MPSIQIIDRKRIVRKFIKILPRPRVHRLLSQLKLQSPLTSTLSRFRRITTDNSTVTARSTLARLLARCPRGPSVLLLTTQFRLTEKSLSLTHRCMRLIPASSHPATQSIRNVRRLVTLRTALTRPARSPLRTSCQRNYTTIVTTSCNATLSVFLILIRHSHHFHGSNTHGTVLAMFGLLKSNSTLAAACHGQLVRTVCWTPRAEQLRT